MDGKGSVIDTLRSLYRKTHFRVKWNGKLNPPLNSNIGVNQGGISSGLMFRKYMSDLSLYLSKEVDIVITNEIIASVLWSDDLILFSDRSTGLQKQQYGLLKFCSTKWNQIYVFWHQWDVLMCISTENLLNRWPNANTLAYLFHQLTGWTRIYFLIITGLYQINRGWLHSV